MDDPLPRTQRRERARRRNRNLAIGAGIVAVVAVIAVVVVALTGSSGDSPGKHQAAAPRTDTLSVISLTAGEVTSDSAGPPTTVSSAQSDQILQVLDNYVTDATLQPLRSGKPTTADLSIVFDAGTLAKISGPDRGVALDEGLPKVTGPLTATAPPVAMVGLGDQTGNLVLVSATLSLDAKGKTAVKGGPLHIARKADFVLAPDPSGAWKVTSYDMVVARGGAGLDATTKAATTTTKAKQP
jgi:hypothetical protein